MGSLFDFTDTDAKSLDRKVADARAILDEAIAEHGLETLLGLFSGGHDSLIATHLVSQYRQFKAAAHIPTTIGIPATRQFVHETCEAHGWPLEEESGPRTYRSLVMQYGFPGPGGHLYMYSWLKQRAVRKLVRAHKVGHRGRVGLVTGVRRAESVRRMGHVEPIYRDGAQVWIAPLIDFSDDDKNAYIGLYQLRRNPVVANLCMSGECLCGAFAHEGELAEIAVFYPETAAEIRQLMADAAAAGVHDRWGERPPPKIKQAMCQQCDRQLGLFEDRP
jgi:3'-phosphoadenosine 5'-phosphosulfate sulfotransferase (PAPS reductase)/FAD synthetase